VISARRLPIFSRRTARSSIITNSLSRKTEHGTSPVRDEKRIPRHELRVPLDMSRISSAVPCDRGMANPLFREVPEDDEEDEDEKKDEEENDEEGEGYSE
jgi:hypothetical protein